ncbi:MAG: hypothetical protein ABI551_24070 [Polyangiaceae bacterium]
MGDEAGVGVNNTAGDSGVASDALTPPSDSGLASDAAPSLGCPLGCLPPAPSGWAGPSALYDGPSATAPTACPPTYIQKEIDAFQDVTAAAAQCSCGTPAFNGAICTTPIVTHVETGCTALGLLQADLTNAASCVTLQNSGHLEVPTPTLTTRGTCSFPTATTTLQDAGIGTVDLACGLPQNAICADAPACVATPVPDAPFTRLCIHHEGDVACPSVDYAKRIVAHTGLSDTRSCSACEGSTSGGGCGNKWGIAASMGACMASPPSDLTTGTCTTASYGIGAVVGVSIAPSGITCLGDGGAPAGAVTTTDPVTFCCNK